MKPQRYSEPISGYINGVLIAVSAVSNSILAKCGNCGIRCKMPNPIWINLLDPLLVWVKRADPNSKKRLTIKSLFAIIRVC
jgi:transcription elongation factor Elf1